MRRATILADGTVLVGTTDGDLLAEPSDPSGLYVADTRVLRRWSVAPDTDGERDVVGRVETSSALDLVLAPSGARNEDPGVLFLRSQRTRAGGLDDVLTVRSTRPDPFDVTIRVEAELDFADQFALRSDGRVWDRSASVVSAEQADDGATIRYTGPSGFGAEATVRASALDAVAVRVVGGADPHAVVTLTATLRVPPGGSARLALSVDGRTAWSGPRRRPAPGSVLGATAESQDPARAVFAADGGPGIDRNTSPGTELSEAARRALADLDALTIPCPGLPELRIPAAGAPWFVTLFGRDSLLTSLLAEPERPALLPDVLTALARFQGTHPDPNCLESPGKIVHETRIDELALAGAVPYGRYYGTVDATPLFVMGVGRLARRGDEADQVKLLEPAVRAAIDWIRGDGGLDATGFIRYEAHAGGLVNQGWKDSADAVCFATGTPARGAIALCEVQGYAWRALRDAASLARDHWGDAPWANDLDALADSLAQRFDDLFWMPEHDFPALALDGDDTRVDVLASNAGHLLWSGMLRPDRARAVADRLVSPGFFSGWGLRTLAAGQSTYTPSSYHNGSVWPHDTALAIDGLREAGFPGHARTLAHGLADAAHALGRLPELFAGHDRDVFPTPVDIPHAAAPQAWACAAALVADRTIREARP